MRRRWWLSFIVLVMLVSTSLAAAQDNTVPLVFEYDDANDEFFAIAELDVRTGDRLDVTVQGGDELYFMVYTDEEDLFEGDSLDDFVATADESIFLEVVSLEEVSGQVTVIPGPSTSAPGQANENIASGAALPVAAGDFTVESCPFDVPPEVDVTCGVLTVPENRLTGTSATIQLEVAIIPSRSESPLPDPIIYLEGGPGGSALAGIESWYNTPYRDQRAIILFDQRGTGFSQPSLNCPEMDTSGDRSAVEACRDRLQAEGVDLAAYNSRENAADVESLRLALGYDQVNLYGISYGTRLALTVMRDYPAGLRSVVLDSVYPPNVDTNYRSTTDTYQLISLMFADCAAHPACAQAFPNLEQRFYDALDQVEADAPVMTDPESGEQYDLFPEDVVMNLSTQLQRTDLVDAIPASLDALANGDYDRYLELVTFGSGTSSGVGLAQELAAELLPEEVTQIEQFAARGDSAAIVALLNDVFDLSSEEAELAAQGFIELGGSIGPMETISAVDPPDIDDDSEGMNLSVQCNEELSFMTFEQAQASADAVGIPSIVRDATFEVTRNEFDQCAVWPAGTADPVENMAVTSTVPTLVLAARYDTATPPEWADLSAQTLSNSYLYHFPMVGHGVIDGGRCPVGIGLAFLGNPQAEPDASCIASMNSQFYIP